MVGDMEDYKVLVSGESKSEEVQDLFFELGCEWGTCGSSYNKMVRVGDYIFSTDSNMLNYGLGIGRKEITLQHLRDLVVLKRNSVDDATHICGLSKVLKLETKDYKIWDATYNVWVDYIGSQTDFRRGLKPIEKEVKMKEKEYIAKVSGDWRLVESHELVSGRIEIPEGAEEYRSNRRFYKNNGKMFYATYGEWGEWVESGLTNYETIWQRNPETTNTTIQNKLKFIEKWLNGEKIQYILGIETEKTQWHNFTEGAMQYIKRSDIKFREAPKYVTINGIEFKSVESLLKHVKNNFDLEDGE